MIKEKTQRVAILNDGKLFINERSARSELVFLFLNIGCRYLNFPLKVRRTEEPCFCLEAGNPKTENDKANSGFPGLSRF